MALILRNHPPLITLRIRGPPRPQSYGKCKFTGFYSIATIRNAGSRRLLYKYEITIPTPKCCKKSPRVTRGDLDQKFQYQEGRAQWRRIPVVVGVSDKGGCLLQLGPLIRPTPRFRSFPLFTPPATSCRSWRLHTLPQDTFSHQRHLEEPEWNYTKWRSRFRNIRGLSGLTPVRDGSHCAWLPTHRLSAAASTCT